MNLISIFILASVLVALAFALRANFRGGRRGGNCCGTSGCSGCEGHCPVRRDGKSPKS